MFFIIVHRFKTYKVLEQKIWNSITPLIQILSMKYLKTSGHFYISQNQFKTVIICSLDNEYKYTVYYTLKFILIFNYKLEQPSRPNITVTQLTVCHVMMRRVTWWWGVSRDDEVCYHNPFSCAVVFYQFNLLSPYVINLPFSSCFCNSRGL